MLPEDRRAELAAALQEKDLGSRSLVDAVYGGLKATLRRRAGDGAYEVAADHEIRLRAAAELKALMQLAGRLPDKVEAPRHTTVVLVRVESGGVMTGVEVRQ